MDGIKPESQFHSLKMFILSLNSSMPMIEKRLFLLSGIEFNCTCTTENNRDFSLL